MSYGATTLGRYDTEWGIAEVMYLEDDLRFFPRKTLGFRLLRDGITSVCTAPDNINYHTCCNLWRELDSAIARVYRNMQICSPS